MYYIFFDHYSGEIALFDNREQLDNFIMEYANNNYREDGFFPKEEEDYSIDTTNQINPIFSIWNNET